MSVETAGHELDREEVVDEGGADAMDEVRPTDELPERPARRGILPWIGALPNPHLGPMVVLNDGGYLVTVCTAGDLLRGCKYFWHGSQE